MNLSDFEDFETTTQLYGETRKIKPLFDVTKKELEKLQKEKLRVYFLTVIRGANEGQLLQLKVCINEEKEEFSIFIKFYDFQTVLQAINYISENCDCF